METTINQKTFSLLGINDDESTCQACGKAHLKAVYWLENLATGEVIHVGRNRKGVTHVRVTLTPADVYTMDFIKCRGTSAPVTLASREMVYADSLRFDRKPNNKTNNQHGTRNICQIRSQRLSQRRN